MAEDLNAIGHHPDPPTWGIPRRTLYSSGPPTGISYEDAPAFDILTGDFYLYQNGVWTLIFSGGGGGGGAGLTYHQGAALDPNGSVTGNVGDVYYSRVALGGDGTTWWKTTGNGTDTGWGN